MILYNFPAVFWILKFLAYDSDPKLFYGSEPGSYVLCINNQGEGISLHEGGLYFISRQNRSNGTRLLIDANVTEVEKNQKFLTVCLMDRAKAYSSHLLSPIPIKVFAVSPLPPPPPFKVGGDSQTLDSGAGARSLF